MKKAELSIRVVNCLIILAILCGLILSIAPPSKGFMCKLDGITELRAD